MGRSLVLLGVLVTVTVSSVPARADPGPASVPAAQTTPAGPTHGLRHRRKGLIAGGLITWGLTYGLSVLAVVSTQGSYNACQGCTVPPDYEARDVLIPVVGPWIAIGARPSDAGLLAVLGLGQAAGLTLFTVGMVGRTDDGPPVDERRAHAFVSFGVLPTRDGAYGFLSGRM
jgi:hypothetical protein